MIKLEIDTSDAAQLGNDLRRDIDRAVSQFKREAQRILRQSIQQNMYGSLGGAMFYSSTKGMVNAFTVTGSGNSFELFMDESKMKMSPWTPRSLGIYMGVSGQDFRRSLLEGLNEGGIAGSSVYAAGFPATGYFETAADRIEKEGFEFIASYLRAAGWNVS